MKAKDNAGILTKDVAASISGDTIQLQLDSNADISSLIPTIVISGKTIDPPNQKAADFRKPLSYVVTAEDGTTRMYKTAVTLISNEKKIISFTFRSADNASLSGLDINGIVGADSILVTLPPAIPLTNLKPFIVFAGETLSPTSLIAQDFSGPVKYAVTATDGTIKNYTVKVTVASRSIKGTIFIAGITSGPPAVDTGMIYALDAGTGQLKWKYVDDRFIESEPTAANGRLYSNDAHGNIFSLDINTGNVIWTYTTGPTQYNQSNTVISNGIVYVCSADSALYALNALNGAFLWKYKDAWGSPTVLNGRVYCPSEGIVCLNANTGSQIWKFNPSSDPSASYPSNPAVADGIVYIGCTDENLYALDANTGNLLWKYFTGDVVETSPTVVNGIVYFGRGVGDVYALDAKTGQAIWNYSIENSVNSSPTIANGVLYFGSNNEYLYALDANTGAVNWIFSDGEWIDESPLFFQGVIYISAREELQAVDASTGKLIWRFSDGKHVMLLPCAVDSLGRVYHTSDSGEQN
ncbi:MAG TPA: PQQ-binding-like beta-propeller repeat protein [Puia sp.]|nr:PQQ-binding-like beta-propeller repeat protein [Puia sp.]